LRFIERRLGGERTALEFNPYFATYDWNGRRTDPVNGYPAPQSISDWETHTRVSPNVPVDVPAGRFNTLMVQVEGVRSADSGVAFRNVPARFEVTAWYSPEVKRYVRMENRLWTAGSALVGEERIDLLDVAGN
jgi:hypothetical protein